jgi:hypothetical protein
LGKLEATKGQKVLPFSYFTMLLELEWFRGAVRQGEKGSKRFRLLNGDGGSIGNVDVYEISENRSV